MNRPQPPLSSALRGRGGVFSSVITLLFVALLCFAGVAKADDAAEKIFSAYQQQIVQVRIVDRGSGAKAAIGSGFSVSADGLIVTNYHVVSEMINRPENYRVEMIVDDSEARDLELMAVDVVHDLAVLRLAEPWRGFLRLATQRPAMGEQLYSFGNPHDLGLTIVQGTYNGLIEKSLYEKIHFTGAINPGMSGGPTINRLGEVVGVNVSTAGNQISFLVPVKYVATLLQRVPAAAPDPEALTASIREQLFANQAEYMEKLLTMPFTTVEIGDYQLPGELAPFIKCWGDTQPKEERLYSKVFQSCSTADDIYLSEHMETGVIRFRHELFSTDELGALRFFNYLEKDFGNAHLTLMGREANVSNYACQSDFVSNDGLDAKTVLCLRGYKEYEGLYDLFLSAATLQKSDEVLHTTLVLAGISKENALRFAQTYFESIAWKP